MNEDLKMIDPRIETLPEEDMPTHLHAKIMRSVFLAGYGKYLYTAAAVACLNLGVLGMELYRTFSTADAWSAVRSLKDSFALSPSYFSLAADTLYRLLPLQSLVAAGFALVISTYIAVAFVRLYRNPAALKSFQDIA